MTIQNSSKTIVITGQSGYLGKLITLKLMATGFTVKGVSREKLYNTEELVNEIRSSYAVINLAGAPILQRWNSKNQKMIYESRVNTTKNLVNAINTLSSEFRPKKIISTSAVGIYQTGETHDENSTNFDEGFIGTVVKDWEKPLQNLPADIQKIIFRIGLVIGKNAKTISKQLLPFKFGLGAKIGSGRQPFPFIHEKDVADAFVWAVEKFENDDVFNLVAPENINNKQFTTAFSRQLHRPAFFTVPEFAIRLVLGKASVLLTQSPEVSSEKIRKAGFQFTYPNITSALKEILG